MVMFMVLGLSFQRWADLLTWNCYDSGSSPSSHGKFPRPLAIRNGDVDVLMAVCRRASVQRVLVQPKADHRFMSTVSRFFRAVQPIGSYLSSSLMVSKIVKEL